MTKQTESVCKQLDNIMAEMRQEYVSEWDLLGFSKTGPKRQVSFFVIYFDILFLFKFVAKVHA